MYVLSENALYLTSVPRIVAGGPVVDVRRLEVSTGFDTVVRRDAGVANCMCLDRDGLLLLWEAQGATLCPIA